MSTACRCPGTAYEASSEGTADLVPANGDGRGPAARVLTAGGVGGHGGDGLDDHLVPTGPAQSQVAMVTVLITSANPESPIEQ